MTVSGADADSDADSGQELYFRVEGQMSETPTREDAWALLTEYTDNPSLIKHALGVEAAMRAYARSYNEDEEMWATIGLIHDFDYQQNPTEETHLHVGTGILRERGWPEEWVRIVASGQPSRQDALCGRRALGLPHRLCVGAARQGDR